MKIIPTLQIESNNWLLKKAANFLHKSPVWAYLSFFNIMPNMKYKTKDGKGFTVNSQKDLVQQMRADSKMDSEDDIDFMVDVSRRCYLDTGANIRTANYRVFVEDLLVNGFLKPC